MASEIGRVVGGRWEIERQLARGGMGVVWVARHRVTRQLVALKVLYPDGPRQDELHERLLREAAAPAQIGHPGLVRVFDAGVDPDDGSMYLAMELLQGESLRDRFARPGLGRAEALHLVVELLEPLAAAHELGFVHRDLKPQNAFLARQADGSERVMLLDFGLSRAPGVKTVTNANNVMGTAIYTAPEQLRSARTVGPQADVWSVGVTLYQILAGKLPFEGHTIALFGKILGEPPPPLRTVAPDAPPALAALVERCLAKDPTARPADAGVLRRELAEALAGAPAVLPGDEPLHTEMATEPIAVRIEIGAGAGADPVVMPVAAAAGQPEAEVAAAAPDRAAASLATADSEITKRRGRQPAGPAGATRRNRLVLFVGAALLVGAGGVLLSFAFGGTGPDADDSTGVAPASLPVAVAAPPAPAPALPRDRGASSSVDGVEVTSPGGPAGTPDDGVDEPDRPTASGRPGGAGDTRPSRSGIHPFEDPEPPWPAALPTEPSGNPRDCGPIVSAVAARCFVQATGDAPGSSEYMLRNLILAHTLLGERGRARPLASRYFASYGTSPFARQIQQLGYGP